MKKRTLLAALVAGVMSFASQSAAAGSYPLRILPLGDSITYGSHGQDDMRSRISLDDLDDGLHPTCAGYAKMAQAWFEAIREIFPTPGSHDDPQPTVVRPEWDDLKPETFAWRFNEAMCPEDAADLANYTIAGRPSDGAKIVSSALSKDRRTVILRLAGLAFGKTYRLTVHNLRNSAKTMRIKQRVDEIRPVDPKSLRRGAEANVPSARRYWLVYSIDLPRDNADYCRNMPTYDVDRSEQVKSFSRVGYYLELRRSGEPLRYVWASFDTPTNDVKAIGIPAGPTGVVLQCPVRNLRYESNDPSVGKGAAAEGYIEFFKCAYNERNTQNVKGARNDRFDWGDNITDPDGNFGSMQVHDVDRGLTLFAYNRWRGGDQDLGIGNRPDYGHTDWTYSFNSPQYDIRRLQVYVCP